MDRDDERYCHIFIKGCSGEDYTGFFRTAGYIEDNSNSVCDSEQCCIGVMTDVGDIELGEWCQMIHALIERAGDQQIYACLKEVIQQECPWLRTARDIEEETLSFYADQGYLNPQWWGYERFQKMCAAIRDEEIDTSKKV